MRGVGGRVGTLGSEQMDAEGAVERAGRLLVVVGGERVGGAVGRVTPVTIGRVRPAAHGAAGC